VLFLIRHAHAGDKRRWTGPDQERPLSATGRREALGLIRLLESHDLDAILSSPATRCEQTVQPLAEQRELSIELEERLNVDGTPHDTVMLLLDLDRTIGNVAICSHGELVGQVIGVLRDGGVAISEEARWAKGSVWQLGTVDGRIVEATYLAPFRADPSGTDKISG
jgi:phosphohistidine phosphatase SixA